MSSDGALAKQQQYLCFPGSQESLPFSAGIIHAWVARGAPPPHELTGVSMGAMSAAAMRQILAIEAPEPRRAELRRWLDFIQQGPAVVQDAVLPSRADMALRPGDRSLDPDASKNPDDPRQILNDHRQYRALVTDFLLQQTVSLGALATLTEQLVRYINAAPGTPGRAPSLLRLWWTATPILRTFLRRSVVYSLQLRPDMRRAILQKLRKIHAEEIAPLLPRRPGVHALIRGLLLHPLLAAALLLLLRQPLLLVLLYALRQYRAALYTLPDAPPEPQQAAGARDRAALLLRLLAWTPPQAHTDAQRALLRRFFRPSKAAQDLARLSFAVTEIPPRGAPPAAQRRIDADQDGGGLLEALALALASPRLFRVPERGWVDGAFTSSTPLPALIRAFDEDQGAPVQRVLYVVYPDPHRPRAVSLEDQDWDIVETILQTLRLNRRRDIDMEIRQLEFEGRLADLLAHLGHPPDAVPPRVVPVSPTHDDLDQALADARDPALEPRTRFFRDVARGCRAILVQGPRRLSPGPCPLARRTETIPEVCAACTQVLQAPLWGQDEEASARPDADQAWREARREPKRVAGEAVPWRPRVVLLLNGGVFRGAFQLGQAAGLVAARLQPDVVVGASVGTIMGALSAAFSLLARADPEREGRAPREADAASRALQESVALYLRAQETLAGTEQLRRMVQQLTARARTILLRPADIWQVLQRPSPESIADLGAAGAPSVLVDAIARLLALDRQTAAALARELLDGNLRHAPDRFLAAIRAQTLDKLGIRRSVMGQALMQKQLSRFLTDALGTLPTAEQPFAARGTLLFGTLTDLNSERQHIFGSQELLPADREPYTDYPVGVMASGAFPGLFEAVPHTRIHPGSGDPNKVFTDGGTFDNLPFLPMYEVLHALQSRGVGTLSPPAALDYLKRRRAHPDLVLVGALHLQPAGNLPPDRPSPRELLAWLSDLKTERKLDASRRAAGRVWALTRQLIAALEAGTAALSAEQTALLSKIVLPSFSFIYPPSADALNGTFAFAPVLGMRPARVCRSIASGCYQTLRSLQEGAGTSDPQQATLAMLREEGRLAQLQPRDDTPHTDGDCPYFSRDGAALGCPFYSPPAEGKAAGLEAPAGVYRACRRARWDA